MVEKTNNIRNRDIKGMGKMNKEKTKTLGDAVKEVNTLSNEVEKLMGKHLSSDREKALSKLESYIKQQILKNPKEFGIG